MKKYLYISIIISAMISISGCEKYLDVNTNPNNPQEVSPYLYLSSIESNMALGIQFDGRYSGKYVQNFAATLSGDIWDRHGYATASDAGGELWRQVYWKLGYNLGDMIRLAEEQERWDMAGAGKVIRAWGWQMLTDFHGEIILSEAFNPDNKAFNYDTQEQVYAEVVRLCLEGITELERTDGAVSQPYMARGDLMYKGDRSKWIKFAYGLLAINAHHLSNKSTYNPDKVIEYVDKAFTGNIDDALVPFTGTVTTDANFFGPLRGMLTSHRQTAYAVGLMNGSVIPGVVDPRMSRMLAPSPDGVYRGLTPDVGLANFPVATTIPNTPYNTVGTPTSGTIGKYLFDNKASFPLMTYAQLQFIKAEAALLKNDRNTALAAYTNGISSHIDFVNQANSQIGAPGFIAISAAEKAAYLSTPAVPPASDLTISTILLQKYIAQYGWGFIETWCDIRRYHYDPAILNGFIPPPPARLVPDNNGKVAYRFRGRYNSEYVWNRGALETIGGLNPDYTTYEMWFSQP